MVLGAVADIENELLEPPAKLPLLKVNVQVAVLPAVRLLQLTVLPLPLIAVILLKPAGNASCTVAVAPLGRLPVLVTFKV